MADQGINYKQPPLLQNEPSEMTFAHKCIPLVLFAVGSSKQTVRVSAEFPPSCHTAAVIEKHS